MNITILEQSLQLGVEKVKSDILAIINTTDKQKLDKLNEILQPVLDDYINLTIKLAKASNLIDQLNEIAGNATGNLPVNLFGNKNTHHDITVELPPVKLIEEPITVSDYENNLQFHLKNVIALLSTKDYQSAFTRTDLVRRYLQTIVLKTTGLPMTNFVT